MRLVINRYDYGSVFGVNSSIGIDSSPRFNALRTLFREFAITTVRIEIVPNDRNNTAFINAAPENNLLMNFNVYDDISITPNWTVPAYTDRVMNSSFKLLDTNRTHTVLRNNRPLARSMNTPWFNANPPNFTTTTGGPRAVTVVGWKIDN